jgi:hypothetical protein
MLQVLWLQRSDPPLSQLLGTAGYSTERHQKHRRWVLELEPCERRGPQAERDSGTLLPSDGEIQAGAPPKKPSPSQGGIGLPRVSPAAAMRCWQKRLEKLSVSGVEGG